MAASYGLVWNVVPTGSLRAEQLAEWPKFYENDATAMKGALARFKNSSPRPGDELLVLAGEPGGPLRVVGRVSADTGKARLSYTTGPHTSTVEIV